jgi:predicted permease
MKPPRWISGLLRRLAPRDHIADVLGDLEEAHGRRVSRRGRIAAWLVTTLEGLDMALALARMRAPRPRLPLSWLDVRLGVRLLRRYPGLTLVAGLALGFAIAVAALTFEAVTQVLNPSLPLDGGDRIVGFRLWNAETRQDVTNTAADLETWRTQLRSVEHVGAFRSVERNLITPDGESESIDLAETSAAAFGATQVPAHMGRTLAASDDVPGAPDVAVIAFHLWQERLGGETDVIGRTVRLGETQVSVVGVMPEGFAFPIAHDAWVPLRFSAADLARRDGPPAGFVFGRLTPGATLANAQAEVAALGARIAREFPDTHAHVTPTVLPYLQAMTNLPALARAALRSTNLGAVLFLVLIASNVALLMFARTVSREAELAMRSALGASRGRLVSQLFIESLVLALAAAAAGLGLASVAMPWVYRIAGIGLGVDRWPFWFHAGLSLLTAIYAVGLAGLVALIAGAWPALRVTSAAARWKIGAQGGSTARFGGVWTGIIVVQVALIVACLPLVVDVGLDTSRFARYELTIPGDEYLTTRVVLQRDAATVDMKDPDTTLADRMRFESSRAALLQELAAEPGIRSATLGDPPGAYVPRRFIDVDGPTQPARSAAGHRPQVATVAPGFFDTLGARIVAGRDLQRADARDDGTTSVVVNESFVTEVLGDGPAVGRRIRFRDLDSQASGDAPAAEPWREVVGVVTDLPLTADPELREQAGIYTPLSPGAQPADLIVHVAGPPGAMAPTVRSIAARVDPALRLSTISTLGDIVRKNAGFYAFWFRVSLAVTGLLLLLSLSCVYAVVSFTVSRRTREIGIRLALGADRRRLLSEILAKPMLRVGIGATLGTAAIAMLLLASQDSVTFRIWALIAGSAAMVVAVSVLACAVPIRRALRIQPTEALRTAE